MQLGLDPIALIAALVAITIAVIESRRNNSVILRLREVRYSACSSIDENGGRMFSQFTVIFQNRGIPLHDMRTSLSFWDPQGCGTISIPLKPRNRSAKVRDEFAKGMIAEIGWKTYEMRAGDRPLLSLLRDPLQQNASLCIYSQGYLTAEFKIGSLRDLAARRWNEFALRINRLFDSHVWYKGRNAPLLRPGNVLPRMNTISQELSGFLRAVQIEEPHNRREAA